jgi:large subunit ribosomal protein L28
MSRVCELSGKNAQSGHRVSHSKTKSKHSFSPNLQKKRLWSVARSKFISMRVCTAAIRTIDKIGLDAYIKRAGLNIK